MSDKNDSYSARRIRFDQESTPDDKLKEDGWEWHLEFRYSPDYPYPFPIVPVGTRDRHDAVGHLSSDGRVHVFNTGIVERLVRAGLRANRQASESGVDLAQSAKRAGIIFSCVKGICLRWEHPGRSA
jgi:hypothetical protein